MRTLALLSLLTLGPIMHAQSPQTLAAMKDHARPLLVFDAGDAKSTERQLTLLASHADAMRERQIVIVGVEGTDKRVPTAMLPVAEWQAAQRRFHVGMGQFTVILLGKDGGEKLRSHQPISWETLQKTIDAMPMRKDEAAHGSR